jgi:uncharacterized membrane protein YgcG
MEGFEDILNYDECRIKKDGTIIDILDGTEFIRQKMTMDANYQKVRQKFAEQNKDQFIHQCSILLTLSYDGVVNFKRKLDSMWPLLTSVVNCNPSHRSMMGTGMFLTMLHNAGVGSGIETHMMEEMLVQELVKLERGVVFTIPALDGKAKQHVYLQARLLYTHLDTKALEKMGLLKLCNSLYGCTLCNLQCGAFRHSLHKCVYKNTRLPLHDHHVLRPAGQRVEFSAATVELKRGVQESFTAEQVKDLYFRGAKEYGPIIKAECEAAIIEINRADNRAAKMLPATFDEENKTRFSVPDPSLLYNVWHHDPKKFSSSDFIKCVKYAYPDHRPQRNFVGESNATYLTNGLIARQKFASNEEQYLSHDVNGVAKLKGCYKLVRNKTKKDCSYNGTHGISPLVEKCESFGFPNFNFDKMHYLLNASNYFLKAYKGERGIQAGSRILEVSQKTHIILKYKKCRPPWFVDNAGQNLADAVQNSMLLPPQYRNDFCFKNPFRLRGYLKAREHMIFLMVFASFVLSFTEIAVQYVVFAAMFASDVCSLLNPMLIAADLVKTIIPCIYETRAVQEGIFPESEQVFIFHEVIDIVHHILKFGHVRGLMCFASERANGLISQSLTKGGVNYMMTMYNRYILRENGCLMRFLDKPETSYDNRGVYSDFSLKLYGESKNNVHLSLLLCNSLFAVIFAFLRAQEMDNMIDLSQFYRMYCAYLHMKSVGGTNASSSFYEWFVKFVRMYNSCDALGNRLCNDTRLAGYCEQFVKVDPSDCGSTSSSSSSSSSRGSSSSSRGSSSSSRGSSSSCPVSTFADAWVGHVFESDLLFLKSFIVENFCVKSFEKVIVKGIRMDCRGRALAYGSEHDNLHTKWHVKKCYKSWFQCKEYTLKIKYNNENKRLQEEVSRSVEESVRFGQLIHAFRLDCPGENVLHGLAMGHCHLRDAVYDKQKWQHFVKPGPVGGGVSGMGVCHEKFICLNYVDSTAVAVCGVNENNKVLFSSDDITNFTPLATVSTDANCYAQPTDHVLDRLFLIPLHPERMHMVYENVFDDIDGTRVWDNSSLRLREAPGSNYVVDGVLQLNMMNNH